jgi:hypothetical protein
MIRSIRNHGFSLTFDNHFTVHVQYSKYHASGRYQANNKGDIYEDITNDGEISSMTAEVTVTDHKGNAVIFGSESSLKHQTTKNIADILFKASIARVSSDMHDFDLSDIKKAEPWE